MRLNCGEDNGVRLAGRTSHDIARIARTARGNHRRGERSVERRVLRGVVRG